MAAGLEPSPRGELGDHRHQPAISRTRAAARREAAARHRVARHRHPRVADPGLELHPGHRRAAGPDGRLPRGDCLPSRLHQPADRCERLARAMKSSAYGRYLLRDPRTGGVTHAFHADRAARGHLIVEPDVYRDAARVLSRDLPGSHTYRDGGIDLPFVQDNHSRSRARARCAACTCSSVRRRASWSRGGRARSSTSRSTFAAARPRSAGGSASTLSADNFRQCYIPPGFAHGFCVETPVAEVEYKCTALYDKSQRDRRRLEQPGAGDRVARDRADSSRSATRTCRRSPMLDILPRWPASVEPGRGPPAGS